MPVYISSLSILITDESFIITASGRTENCSYIIGINTCPPPKTRLPMRYVFSKRFRGARLGQSFFLAISLKRPAVIKIIPNNQKFHHLIFLGFCSVCGIRLRLKLVVTPPKTISNGNIQGCLNNRKVATAQTPIMIHVTVFFMEILNAIIVAYTRKPTAIGGMNLKISTFKAFLSI